MYQERILLSSKDILEKEFKFDARGYRPQEVDKYLDVIIHDFEEYDKIIAELELEKKEIVEDNIRLKQEIRKLKTQAEAFKESVKSEPKNNNADLLRRISNLVNIIYKEK